jgi:hypothetical protein
MDERAERIGKNEALFREVNERIEEVSEGGTIEFLCECGDAECTQPLALAVTAYEEVRAEPDRFAILPGHELPDVEEIVQRHDGYLVVRKFSGGAAEVAEARDLRS